MIQNEIKLLIINNQVNIVLVTDSKVFVMKKNSFMYLANIIFHRSRKIK